MDAKIQLPIEEGIISPSCHFVSSWSIECGLTHQDALHFTIAVSEIITDIILYAYPKDVRGSFEMSFHHTYSNVEIVISELGQPFDPDRHKYNPAKVIEQDNFEGAGFRVARRFTDEFLFINKGKEGKEYRLSKAIKVHTIDHLLEHGKSHRSSDLEQQVDTNTDKEYNFSIFEVEASDAEDIARLIYSAYEYSYTKEDLYFPKKIEKRKWGQEKIGVIVRTEDDEPVGYFAIKLKSDSNIGEVGEAVVSPQFRRHGIMSRMMKRLIELADEHNIEGLYGIAVTVHPASQKVNNKFGFHSSALMLAASKTPSFKGFDEEYPQPESLVLDFLPIKSMDKREVYLPERYKDILSSTYETLDFPVEIHGIQDNVLKEHSSLDLQMDYTSATSLIVVNEYGEDFRHLLSDMIDSLEDQKELQALFIDLPLQHPGTPECLKHTVELGFIYCGIVPLFHRESDYLRMQKIYSDLDFDLIDVFSEFGNKIKSLIYDEYHQLRKDEKQNEGRTPGTLQSPREEED